MRKKFIPPGYIPIRDYRLLENVEEVDMRYQLYEGKLVAVWWDNREGRLNEITKDTWLTEWSQQVIETGIWPAENHYYHPDFGRVWDEFPVLVKYSPPPTQDANSGKRGPQPRLLQRVKETMRKIGLAKVSAMKQEAWEIEFGASRDTCRRAFEELKAENNSDKTSTNPNNRER